VIQTSQRTDEQCCRAGTAFDENPFAVLAPAAVADASPGQVDDRVSTFEATGIDGVADWIPTKGGLTGLNRAAHDPDDVVAGSGEMGTQCLADRTARSRDYDLHMDRSIGAALRRLSPSAGVRGHSGLISSNQKQILKQGSGEGAYLIDRQVLWFEPADF
jgi:hypothetical protein